MDSGEEQGVVGVRGGFSCDLRSEDSGGDGQYTSVSVGLCGSWVNLKGGGQLADKVGNGEQMNGMVPGLGSVNGCPRPTPRQRRNGF